MNWTEYSIQNARKGGVNYPKNLLLLKQPPKQIYYRGAIEKESLEKSIAIVGSRRMSRYGASVVDKFVSVFASENITTISGYMYGVDTVVHTKTVEYGGKTVAVMGSGINAPYPPENDGLYTKILQTGGLVLSEYSPDAKPKLWMYPQRNRIVAALATLGVLVIEAGERSGSLITVRFARQLKKKIFSVPGPITSSVSAGTNMLIKKGWAKLVTEPNDILRVKSASKSGESRPQLTGLEKEIYEILRSEEMSVDEISVVLGKDMVVISTAVSLMALRGFVSEAGGKYFVV